MWARGRGETQELETELNALRGSIDASYRLAQEEKKEGRTGRGVACSDHQAAPGGRDVLAVEHCDPQEQCGVAETTGGWLRRSES